MQFLNYPHALSLHTGWYLAATAPGAVADAAQLGQAALDWRPAVVPGTVAQSLGVDLHQGLGPPVDYDGQDWWYRCTFTLPQGDLSRSHRLRCDGLATLCEVWLNDAPILVARNMFVPHAVNISESLRAENDLVLCFRSLTAEPAVRRPRARWKTGLVNQQQLRWIRTTPLGRIPGWTPPVPPVGPWRAIALEQIGPLDLVALDLQCRARGSTGIVQLRAQLQQDLGAGRLSEAVLHVGPHDFPLTLGSDAADAGAVTLAGDFEVPDVPLWWPHTHGTAERLPCRIEARVHDEAVTIECGQVGFKAVALNRDAGRVQLEVNGVPVFCRGACWTVNDFVSLGGSREELRRSLELARDAGANMLRVGGTMVYESDDFYELCDDLGLMVWQDFMFANMDYPVGDAAFRHEIEAEVAAQLNRLQKHPCVTVYCGNSEVQQQAAMQGKWAGEWSNEFFDETLPKQCAAMHPGIPYFPSTPCEGALPFHVGTGLAHYYGVGAYRRPLHDLQSAAVKFAPECLGFSNVPDPATIDLVFQGAPAVPHHPAWKARVPRDHGAGWDFEDIRDHYLRELYAVDPVALRSQDLERYFALSRVVTGEVMRHAYAQWRRPGSACGGALVWFWKDLWPGAGWGLVDSENLPKAAYYYLKRAWAPQAVLITDAGLDGLNLHVINDTPAGLSATVELELLHAGRTVTAAASEPVEVAAHTAVTLNSDALLGRFADVTYAYRFGPPPHDLVVARLRSNAPDIILSEDCYFPLGLALPFQDAAQVEVAAALREDDSVLLHIEAGCLLQSVSVEMPGFAPDDNYFHLSPGRHKPVVLRPLPDHPSGALAKKLKGTIGALNLRESITFRARETSDTV